MNLLQEWLYDINGNVIGHLLYCNETGLNSWFDNKLFRNKEIFSFQEIRRPTGKIFKLKVYNSES